MDLTGSSLSGWIDLCLLLFFTNPTKSVNFLSESIRKTPEYQVFAEFNAFACVDINSGGFYLESSITPFKMVVLVG